MRRTSHPPFRVPETEVSRRRFLRYGSAMAALAGLERMTPGWARPVPAPPGPLPVLSMDNGAIDLVIAEAELGIGGHRAVATTINGTIPGPLLRFREGEEAVIRVTNQLDEDTSIHWHGILVPNPMDGVPQVNFPGISPGETFTYRYPVRQYGTYWYHSHSGFQEQLGHYGPLIIDPAGGDPYEYGREYVIVLSDWTFEDPYRVLARLKKRPGYYNFEKRTLFDFFSDVAENGLGETVSDRLMWGKMRMNPTDISDVTGATYTYMMNGLAPESNWTALFEPGERVRLRFINAAAASFFDVRVPGLEMEVVQVSGQNVQPVTVDEFRIAIAETYDVIVRPETDLAHTIFAEAMDRSGYARGTLAPRKGMEAAVPDRRERPLLTMAEMGMLHPDMPGSETGGHGMPGMEPEMPVGAPTEGEPEAAERVSHDGGKMGPPGRLPETVPHSPDHHGPGNAAVPTILRHRLDEPGVGLGEDGRRVLVYSDVRALERRTDFRAPDREIELHLTGNMERFMWSIDGKTFSQSEPIHVEYGERIRLTMVNDTMMNHPMHLHGMWMELENGHESWIPRVHTINVKPAERQSLLFTADAPGPWAFHCHVLYHMEAGMFRVFHVTEPARGDRPAPAHREDR